ncbi:MFS transporter [Camelimonas fluminis]|uniref:MFS transporter n=1 Tax=Camelimonas fluminis TaxID=1576911 RepID=A0ABV7UH90_9HYPH|nr:MFS transporter [Camelimonas fluminis]GHE61826.1 MFS transporter [Camelimonas fluminis]
MSDAAASGPRLASPTSWVAAPRVRPYACAITALLLALAQGMGQNFFTANLQQVQGQLGATPTEGAWLTALYIAPYASLSLMLRKLRAQFGLRSFAECAILAFVLVTLLHLVVDDLRTAMLVQFASGVAAAPLSALNFLYMLEAVPADKRLTMGLSVALTTQAIGAPLARVLSPPLLEIGGWHGLYLLTAATAMAACAMVLLTPLTPVPREKAIHWLDIVSYLLIAVGFGLTALALGVGRYYWWTDAPFLGVMIAAAVLCCAGAAVIELNRSAPFLDFRWIASPGVLHFAGVMLVFRMITSEQSSGVYAFFQNLGLLNEQMRTMWLIVLAATAAGGLSCVFLLRWPRFAPLLHLAALLLFGAGSWMDADATVLTRPEQMYLSQAMIGFGMGLFMPPAMAIGLQAALAKGPQNLFTFIMVFLSTQSLGGVLGSAVTASWVAIRTRVHLDAVYGHLTMANPLVSERLEQLAATVNGTPGAGYSLLAQKAQQQAMTLAYTDVFRGFGALALGAALILVIHLTIVFAVQARAKRNVSVADGTES